MSNKENGFPFNRSSLSATDELTEVSLLLPRWQMHALECAAEAQGLTAGQLLRRVIAQVAAGAMTTGQGYFLA